MYREYLADFEYDRRDIEDKRDYGQDQCADGDGAASQSADTKFGGAAEGYWLVARQCEAGL